MADETGLLEVGGQGYRVTALNARTQFHVLRRLAPLLTKAQPLFAAVQAIRGQGAQDVTADAMLSDDVLGAFAPMAELIASLPDQELDYVMDKCLAACHRKVGEVFRPVANMQGQLMFQDINLPTQLRLVGEVIMLSLGNFWKGPLGKN